MDDALPGRITVNPDPLVAGQAGEVCYDFSGLSRQQMDLEVSWQVVGQGTVVATVSPTQGVPCVKVVVPAGAFAVRISDGNGPSDDYVGTVSDG